LSKQIILAVYDSGVEAYLRPWTAQAKGQAIREFTDQAKNKETPIGQHPEDYSLFILAEYTDHDGRIVPMDPPKCIARAHELPTDQEER